MEYEAVIGLEVHAQLNTNTKIFCSCANEFGAKPNANTCPVCQGHPGSLPVFNEKALDKAVKAGLALNGKIAKFSKFDRKNYFYPDLPKAYQISQFDMPIVEGGHVDICNKKNEKKRLNITRIHLEEDAGKLIHPADKSNPNSFVDLNRCGTPLIEIVSEPEMHSSEDAYLYLTELKSVLRYIDVSDCNMEEGSLRVDVNVSIRPVGQEEFGTRAEVKNMNSFSGVAKAIDYEIKRQKEVLQSGEKVIQETRLYDANKEITGSMRGKENAHDYRYFPDPDLVPIIIDDEYINSIGKTIPELAKAKKERFVKNYKITEYDAATLCEEQDLANYYEDAVKSYPKQPKKIANWIQAEVKHTLNDQSISISEFKVKATHIGEIFKLIDENIISSKIAKEVFTFMIKSGKAPTEIVEEKGLRQVDDSGAIEKFVDDVLARSEKQVEQFKNGKTGVIGYFVGQVMQATKGKANPQMVNELLVKKLSE